MFILQTKHFKFPALRYVDVDDSDTVLVIVGDKIQK